MVSACESCGKTMRRRANLKTSAEAMCLPCRREGRLMSRAIDWMAVEWVCQGQTLKLTAAEMRMVVRRLDERLLSNADSFLSGKMTAKDLAKRLRTTADNVQAMRCRLASATKQRCPVCRDYMWVLETGVVEEHPDRFYQPCVMSDRWVGAIRVLPMPAGLTGRRLRGLASIRPDLYGWAS